MATVDATRGTIGQDLDGTDKMYILSNRLDFSVNNTASGDTVKALDIAAGTMVLKVWTVVVTKEGGTLTATVGDGSGANSWDAETNLNATVGTVAISTEGTDAYAVGKIYAADDTIDLVMSANAGDAAVMDIYAECINITKLPKTDVG